MSTCAKYTPFEMRFPYNEPPHVRLEQPPEAAAGKPVSREAAEVHRNSNSLYVDSNVCRTRVRIMFFFF